MSTPTIRKLGIPLLAGAMGLSLSAFGQDGAQDAQGLYSAEDLIGAEVFDANGEEIGNVEDILLGNDMGLYSLVIQTNEFLGIGGTDIVAKRGDFTVRVEDKDPMFGNVKYDVHITSAGENLKGFEEYTEQWWDDTAQNLNDAWESARDTTKSAWESTKQATASAWESARESTQ
ncbi:hypothetical protein CWI75_16180 [Kineobactrum sediminis]|uniref:PRC-barrel domain-containing protein n=1 Tax=Kineobactrum sediminis TaxID=1905677 RepID=A0A2N5XZ40_9GAMM|nr:PRC-barrel domain-containing protein [Kineobactrum sediminis]PLW81369.1 hypothetical protein CWI75_16180 [Kineobactrum sediminis]